MFVACLAQKVCGQYIFLNGKATKHLAVIVIMWQTTDHQRQSVQAYEEFLELPVPVVLAVSWLVGVVLLVAVAIVAYLAVVGFLGVVTPL